MNKANSFIFTLLLLINLAFATHAKTIIYQPLHRDSIISQSDWHTFIDNMHKDGYKEIVIQWSQYGADNFIGANSFLRDVVDYSASLGIKFWIGLYLPSDYYTQLENTADDNIPYFEKALSSSKHLLTRIELQNIVPQEQRLGWYLPTELTHSYQIAESSPRIKSLLALLKDFKNSTTEPASVSYFLGANTTLTQALSDISALSDIGFEVWLQSSNGLRKKTLAPSVISKMDCSVAVIHENFQQISAQNSSFVATPLVPSQAFPIKTCHKPIIFSARYLPYSPLATTDVEKSLSH
jgi:hypothetical protein